MITKTVEERKNKKFGILNIIQRDTDNKFAVQYYQYGNLMPEVPENIESEYWFEDKEEAVKDILNYLEQLDFWDQLSSTETVI